MDESESPIINNLSERDFSEPNKPRMQERTVGQTSALRRFDFTDRLDMQRLKQISNDPEIAQWFLGGSHSVLEIQDEPSSDAGIIDWAKEPENWDPENTDSACSLFAISGSTNVAASEIGEVQGWIAVWRDEEKRSAELIEKGFINSGQLRGDDALPFYEISYAKYPGATGGQISSAVRQVCRQINIETSKSDHSEVPTAVVTAYVDLQNEASGRVLEAAGFMKKGTVDYEGFNEEHLRHDVYILDWKKWNEIMHQKAESEFQSILRS